MRDPSPLLARCPPNTIIPWCGVHSGPFLDLLRDPSPAPTLLRGELRLPRRSGLGWI